MGPALHKSTPIVLVLIIAAKLGDVSGNDCIDPEDMADLCGSGGISPVAVGEVLLMQDLVDRVPLDDAVGAFSKHLIDQNVGDALADIDVGPKDSLEAGHNSRVA